MSGSKLDTLCRTLSFCSHTGTGVTAPMYGGRRMAQRGEATCLMKAVEGESEGLHVGLLDLKGARLPGLMPLFSRSVSSMSPKPQPSHLAGCPHPGPPEVPRWRGESRTGCTR